MSGGQCKGNARGVKGAPAKAGQEAWRSESGAMRGEASRGTAETTPAERREPAV